MKQFFKNIILLLFIMSIFSCKKENLCDCVKSTGKETTEERIPEAAFNEIELFDKINLFIQQDTVQKIKVEAGEHLLPLIETSIKDNKLTIKNNNKCNWVRSYKKEINVYLSVKNLNQLTYRGVGNISSLNTIVTDSIKIESWNGSGSINLTLNTKSSIAAIHTGSVDITLKGYSGVSCVYSIGNGFIYAEELETGYTFLNNSGTGNCSVWVTKELGVEMHSTGDVYYKGNPYSILYSDITGEGKLIKN